MDGLNWSYNHRCLYNGVLTYLPIAFRFLGRLGERFASIVGFLGGLTGEFTEDVELLNLNFSLFGRIRILLCYKGVFQCFYG
jgi:hypothetical protein